MSNFDILAENIGLVRVSESPVVDVRDEHKVDVKAWTAAGTSVAALAVLPSASEANAAVTFHYPSAALFRPIAPSPALAPTGSEGIFTKIKRLSELHQKGILTDEKFLPRKPNYQLASDALPVPNQQRPRSW
ncbi:MAG TPA: hypothetical protein VIL30_15125 [Ramlibacter sp.]